MKDLHPRLQDLLKKAEALIGSVESKFEGGVVYTVEEQLRLAQSLEEDRERRVRINMAATEIANFYKGLPPSKREADGQVLIRDTQAFAYASLIPPRSGGRLPAYEEVLTAVRAEGIVEGINYASLEAAYDKFQKKVGTIYEMKFAECELPTKGETGSLRLLVEPFPKSRLIDRAKPFEVTLPAGVKNVTEGAPVARITPGEPGKPGRSVRGEEIPAIPATPVKIEPGSGIRVGDDGLELRAAAHGVLVQDGMDLDVVPFYTVAGDLPPGQELRFNGHVFILGNVPGPAIIECEDLYVAGNFDSSTAECTGDVFVQGGIVGKRKGQVGANGSIFCRFISDATIEAMGDVVVRDSIAYSDVTSNGRIIVFSAQGAIFGGTVAALKEISARNIGSDFASYTTTIAGKDFLTGRRLSRVELKMKEYEERLAKISMIKKRLGESQVQVSRLTPEQQDVYVSLLQREAQAIQELNSLRRSKEKFDAAMQDFLTASIRVVEELYPPVKVQICSAVEEITRRMKRVTLVLDRGNRVFAMPGE